MDENLQRVFNIKQIPTFQRFRVTFNQDAICCLQLSDTIFALILAL